MSQQRHAETEPEIPVDRVAAPQGVVRSCMAWALGADEDVHTDAYVLWKQLQRRVALLVVVVVACILVYAQSEDPKDLLYSTRHGAMAVLAVVSAGWLFLLLPTCLLACLWVLVYVHDHPGLLPKHATYDPLPGRSALTIANRLVMQLCAALTCVFVTVTLLPNLLWCSLLIAAYLILVPKAIQLVLLRFFRRRLERWTRATIGLGELVYLQHVFFPLVTCIGFIVLYSQGAETLGLRELAWSVVALVVAHWTFAALWFAFSLREPKAMQQAERDKRAEFRRTVAERSRWEGPTILLGLGIFAALPFLCTAQASKVAKQALVERRHAEGPSYACPKIDELADAEVAIFLVSDNQFRALDGRTIAHSPQIAELVAVAVRPVELDLLSVAAFDQFARLYHELLARKHAMGWTELDVRWAHLGDFGDLACHSELRRLEGRIPCFGADSLAGIVPGNHDSYFTGNFGWHPDWSLDAACPGAGPISRTEAPSLASVIGGSVSKSSVVLAHTDADEHSFFASIADLGHVGHRQVVGVFFDTSDFAGSSAGAAGVQGEITSDQKEWVIDALEQVGGEPLAVFFMHHPTDDLSTIGHWRVDEIAEILGDRLIAVVSGHTHQSQQRTAELDDREVHEFVVGSTTDPPQEAALLTIRVAGNNELALRFQTVPSVARADQDDGAAAVILASECEQVLAGLRETCECRPLFDPENELGRDGCETTSLDNTLNTDPLDAHQRDMANRARALFDCTERVAGTDRPRWTERFRDPPTLDRDPYRAFEDQCSAGELVPEARHKELVCLSWVASTLQGRDRSEEWTFAEASLIAFERLAANDAWRTEVYVDIPN